MAATVMPIGEVPTTAVQPQPYAADNKIMTMTPFTEGPCECEALAAASARRSAIIQILVILLYLLLIIVAVKILLN